ncbi:MAG: DUF362 domain-containing protein [Candidatus Thorarchaeota archaeon SMTZ1-45]|nr:MAG: hypothetical protein AM325_15435 [Candidatus Thorarchaeota archaeon SMTZ1-45]
MTKIAVISTNDRVYGVNKSFELLDIEPIKGKRVVLKPNFNTADPPPASTHMDTFRQILVKIQEMGAKSIIVAERCGPANTNEAFRKKGLYELANEFGFDILNLETVSEDQWVMKNLDGSHWKNGFLFAKVYDEAECVIETCCLKTHQYGGHFTLSLKNATALVPRVGYKYMNELHSSPHQRKMIAEINAAYNWDIIIMDGVLAFVDGGPMEGTRREASVFVAGTDKIAIDAVGVALLRILGTTPEVSEGPIFEQEQIARAVELGIGISSFEEIEFITDSHKSEELVKQIRNEFS